MDMDGMDTFEFHLAPDREERRKAGLERQWEVVIRLRSEGYYENAVWPGRKALPQWLTEAVENASGGQPFSFDKPFSPWQLYGALNRSGLRFMLETDYVWDVTEGPKPAPRYYHDVFGEHIRKTAVGENVITTEKWDEKRCYTSALAYADEDICGAFTTSTEKAARRLHRHMVLNLKKGRPPEAGVEKLLRSLWQPGDAPRKDMFLSLRRDDPREKKMFRRPLDDPWENSILKTAEIGPFRVVTGLDLSSARKRCATIVNRCPETLFSPNEAIARKVHNRVVRNIKHGRHPLDQAQKIIDDYMHSWHVAMDDIADGRYDGDVDEVNRLIGTALVRAEKPGCRPEWKESLERAVQHRTRLLTAKAVKTAALPDGKEEAFKKLMGQASAAGTPDWVLSLYDILAGKYDEDIDAANRLLAAAEKEAKKPDCAPGWQEALKPALEHLAQLLIDRAGRIAALSAERDDELEILKAQAAAAGSPDWVLPLYDVLAGKYDDDLHAMDPLLDAAAEEADKPDCCHAWAIVADKALDHCTRLLIAKASKLFPLHPAGSDDGIKEQKVQAAAAGSPDWLLAVYDILAGKYDEDADEMRRLLAAAEEGLAKPGCDPGWEEVVTRASDHAASLIFARAEERFAGKDGSKAGSR